MREAAFVKRNQARWQEAERTLNSGKAVEPDKLAEIFIQLTDDLSFARTQYPKSRTANYLNNLASKIHLEIYKNKKENKSRIITFWKYELPAILYGARKALLYSFLIFMIASSIGIISTLYDDTFVRLMLGDYYVNMTLENIKQGKPTGVYGKMDQWDMFLYIAVNNVQVSFFAFALGLLTSFITGFYIFYEGMRLGAFFTMFYTEDLLPHAVSVVMLHGTIELSVIIVAGAAGIIMGNSFLHPGTYSRLESFKIGAMKGMKIVIGLVPFFLIAAFIEGFITRYEFMHWSIKAFIIGGSVFIIVYYFVVYPFIVHKNARPSDH